MLAISRTEDTPTCTISYLPPPNQRISPTSSEPRSRSLTPLNCWQLITDPPLFETMWELLKREPNYNNSLSKQGEVWGSSIPFGPIASSNTSRLPNASHMTADTVNYWEL